MTTKPNTKTVTVKIQLSGDYKYCARQPWGSIYFFKNKPTIVNDGDGEYWGVQADEKGIDIDIRTKIPNWKKSLRTI